MSDSDSFINEVSEEVRRDELFGYIRKYGWIAVTLVLALVGGAAYNEYSKAKTESAAQAVGDAMLTAMGEDDPAARAQALAAVEAQGPSAAVTALLTAATQQEAGQLTEAAATLNTLAQNAEVPEIYRDLAAIKAAMLPNEDTDARKAALEALSAPGAPFRMLALEQIGLMQVDAGDVDAAIATMQSVLEDAEASQGLQDRAQTLIVALGGTPVLPVTTDAPITTE